MGRPSSGPLAGKTVVLGVTGSIAAFKVPHVASSLTAMGARVVVVMTENATRFVTPLTFETLTGIEVVQSMFPEGRKVGVESAAQAFERDDHLGHVHLSEAADLVIVAPATGNIIGKMAGGIADDFLSTELMAMACPIIVAPAMNVRMMESHAVVENIEKLKARGVIVVEAEMGRLASGAVGKGRLANVERIIELALDVLLPDQDLAGKRVVVTAGPTREAIDPVRHISNPSTGTMGFALAERALRRGADVTLISGPTALEPPEGIKFVSVTTTDEMYEAVAAEMTSLDVLLMAAAPADYRPKVISEQKLKKAPEAMVLELEPTVDILTGVAEMRQPGQCIVGFALETEAEEENARAKLERKGLDLIVVNNPTVEGAAFGTETNVATLIGRSGREESPGKMSKDALADLVLTAAVEEMGERKSGS